ncbi:uncharacterized protein LOC129911057 isoform X2 [Episyrphus balteatus]|uniref:uncharacterized protein LOC129911057 isoform X2 n=1 Tax=Episyrphus balteatus TaxID=286459 RepID=UPI002485C312|nr:uncharacterized protein LOC129911057 isoform X2 [Episyrphus balteatus]
MEDTKHIDLDELVRKMYALCPNLPQSDDFNKKLRTKLQEQIKEKVPKVELKQLDLNYIILNVKNSLTEFQKRIDESVAQQQLRRTTRVRKTKTPDSLVIEYENPKRSRSKNSSSSPSTSTKVDTETACTSTKCCHQSGSDLGGFVEVESLPVSASTNLVTIFVPSILQEKLHSVKYKISIDLNRLDLTTKILDLNVSQLESDLKRNTTKASDETKKGASQECKLTYEIKDHNNVQLVEEQTPSTSGNAPQIEVKTPVHESEKRDSLEPVVCIVEEKEDEMQASEKQRAPKRKLSKPSNGPPKKRGRKPGSKNKAKTEKSELAKYVEMFECSGNSPSSAVSQIVTSTTQNWEVLPEQTPQIAYFMNGEWTTLSAPSNNVTHAMVTTTNGSLIEAPENENFIPFDDFVNFIDNPSLDVGNNVIARVLEGTVDTQEITLNQQGQPTMHLDIENIEPPKSDANTQTNQYDLSTKKDTGDINQTKSRQSNMIGNLSKETNTTDVLGLTKTQESNNVIFSTCRSMPSLDIEEGDLFCSTPQRTNISDNIIAFSMNPQVSDHNRSFNQNEDTMATDSAIEIDKRETLHSSSDCSGFENNSKSTHMPSNIKDKSEVIKEMSLLEIEKDFDDSLLDFGNCLDDDLLSLAPSSCFNSPLDDRFADSNFLNVEEPETKSCTDTSNSVPAPRSHLETSLVTLYEDEINPALKNFKIPRVKIVRQKSLDDNLSEKLPTVILPPTLKEPEKPNAVRVSSPFSLTIPPKPQTHNLSLNLRNVSGATPQMMSTLEISKIFGSLCYKFLADMCFENPCKFSHQFLDLDLFGAITNCLNSTFLSSVKNMDVVTCARSCRQWYATVNCNQSVRHF